MWTFVAQRLVWIAFMAVGVTFLVFMTMHIAPGDPARLIAGQDAPQETVEMIRERLQLDQPVLLQYASYMSRVLQGDFGRSLHGGSPVVNQLQERLPVTLSLAGMALLIGVTLGLITGIISAVFRNSWFDKLSLVVSFIGASLPSFWLGLLLILLFAVQLRWFPVAGGGDFRSLVLPAITLGLRPAATISRLTRTALLDVLYEDYVRTARSKGLNETTVILKHALRNALVTVVTAVGVLLGGLLAGSVVVEVVFGLPGIGDMLISSIMNRDFPMVQAPLLFIAITFVLVNLLVDLTYSIIDPTIRTA